MIRARSSSAAPSSSSTATRSCGPCWPSSASNSPTRRCRTTSASRAAGPRPRRRKWPAAREVVSAAAAAAPPGSVAGRGARRPGLGRRRPSRRSCRGSTVTNGVGAGRPVRRVRRRHRVGLHAGVRPGGSPAAISSSPAGLASRLGPAVRLSCPARSIEHGAGSRPRAHRRRRGDRRRGHRRGADGRAARAALLAADSRRPPGRVAAGRPRPQRQAARAAAGAGSGVGGAERARAVLDVDGDRRVRPGAAGGPRLRRNRGGPGRTGRRATGRRRGRARWRRCGRSWRWISAGRC